MEKTFNRKEKEQSWKGKYINCLIYVNGQFSNRKQKIDKMLQKFVSISLKFDTRVRHFKNDILHNFSNHKVFNIASIFYALWEILTQNK